MILSIVNVADLSRLVGELRHLGGCVPHHAERFSSRLLGFWALAVAGLPAAGSALELGMPFADNAVFQQQIPVPVWGTSRPGAEVTVTFGAQTKTSTANQNGKWRVTLDPLPANKLASVNEAPAGIGLTVSAGAAGTIETKTINNILIGEVWLCSGQSNMAGRMGGAAGRTLPDGSVLTGDYPALRQMVSPSTGPWLVCTPETVGQFKKVCFYFARRLQQDILVPVGIVNAAVGGSTIETWLNQVPYERGGNYETQIAPLAGYGLRGVVWYQGESNEKDGRAYLPKLRSLILGWREAWGQGDFPLYFVQLPAIGTSRDDNPAGGDGRAEIRQAQFEALALPNTGMSVAIDIGDLREHPPNKCDTGVRLARWALHRDYAKKDLVPSGPLYRSCKIGGDKIRVSFDYAQNGLMLARKDGFAPPVPTPGAAVPWLSIQAKDGTWHWAEGVIDGTDLLVSCKDVRDPVAVRYAYTNFPAGFNLYNKDGLPASPFSSCGY